MTNAEYILKHGISFKDLRAREIKGGQTWEIYTHKPITIECLPSHTQETVILGYTEKRLDVSMGTKAILTWLDEEHYVELLSNAEREELQRFKDGWRGKILWIEKQCLDEYNEFISVWVEFPDGKEGEIIFTPFKRGTRYKGLDFDKRYIPENLLL